MVDKTIKWRWTYNQFKQIIVDFPPYCTYDNFKLQIDDRKLPVQDFICPSCTKTFNMKSIYSSYRLTKRSIKKKNENLYFYEYLKKQNIEHLIMVKPDSDNDHQSTQQQN